MSHHPEQSDFYPIQERPDVEPFIPPHAQQVLDVGCGPGGFGRTLRRVLGPTARLVGVEATSQQAVSARLEGFDEVIDGYFPDALIDRSELFDLICFNDVLEHIVDPWQTLRDCTNFLTENGHVLAAIPNVQYAPVSAGLLRGRWTYTDMGILDRTHVRFFTRETVLDLFSAAGYRVVNIEPANSVWAEDWLPQDARGLASRLRRRLLNTGRHAFLRAAPDSEFKHFVVLAVPQGPREASIATP